MGQLIDEVGGALRNPLNYQGLHVKSSKKKLGFRRSSQDPQVPDYLSGEALLSASKDCLSFAIIETDRLKLEKILNDLKELMMIMFVIQSMSFLDT